MEELLRGKGRHIGIVTKYLNDKGYGFIKSQENGEKYFVHVSQIQDKTLCKGYLVEFSVGINKKTGRENAFNVIVIESY